MIPHEVTLRFVYYVLTTGIRWRDVASETRCSGETARKRLIEWEECGALGQIHAELLRLCRCEAGH